MMSYLVVFIEKDDFLKFFSLNTPNFSEGQLPLYGLFYYVRLIYQVTPQTSSYIFAFPCSRPLSFASMLVIGSQSRTATLSPKIVFHCPGTVFVLPDPGPMFVFSRPGITLYKLPVSYEKYLFAEKKKNKNKK